MDGRIKFLFIFSKFAYSILGQLGIKSQKADIKVFMWYDCRPNYDITHYNYFVKLDKKKIMVNL